MAWVRKIVKGRERLVFVSDVVPKKTSVIQKKVPAPGSIISGQLQASTYLRASGRETEPRTKRLPLRAPIEPAVPAPIPRAEPTRRAVGAVPSGLTFAQQAAALAGQPRQPTQTVAQGLASAVTGVPRTLGRAGVSLAAPIVGAGVGTAATLAGGGNLVRNILTASEQFRGAGRAALGQGAQPRTAQIPINTPESLGLYQGRPRLGGAEGRAIQGPSALDVFLQRQVRSTSLGELTSAVPRLQERARFAGASMRQQAQMGAALVMNAIGTGDISKLDVISDATASYLIGPLGYGSIPELMRDLGFIPNPDAPGTWLRGEVVQPGGTSTGGGGGNGGGFSFIPSTISDGRGGRSAMGLVNWRI